MTPPTDNTERIAEHLSDLDHLSTQLARHSIAVEDVIDQVAAFEVAVPSWSLGTGGTRFGRFPGKGEPQDVYQKLDDIAVIHHLTRATPRVSLHLPWDEPEDPARLREYAAELGLAFDAVNSNTFQDQPNQPLSYKFGSLSHADRAVRKLALEHVLHVMEIGQELGSQALTVWLADGSNYPGQMHLRRSYDRLLRSFSHVYDALPDGWLMFIEHKPFEPAFYSTVVQDWGSSLMLAQVLGEKAQCLVDLGHHLPGTNIEQVVARLITARKLGGFHFNDSKYGDDDLTTGSIHPYQLFLIFVELVDAQMEMGDLFNPAYMIDQSHNVKDPVAAMLQTVDQLQQAYAKAALVPWEELFYHQDSCDALMAERTLQKAFATDVRPIVAEARRRGGGSIDPISSFRMMDYRSKLADRRTECAYVPPQSL